MITPKVENTTEKPRTKNTVFKIILVLLTVIVCDPPLWFSSLNVDPEIYAKNAGIIGKIHGATNEPNPANTATARPEANTSEEPALVAERFAEKCHEHQQKWGITVVHLS